MAYHRDEQWGETADRADGLLVEEIDSRPERPGTFAPGEAGAASRGIKGTSTRTGRRISPS